MSFIKAMDEFDEESNFFGDDKISFVIEPQKFRTETKQNDMNMTLEVSSAPDLPCKANLQMKTTTVKLTM